MGVNKVPLTPCPCLPVNSEHRKHQILAYLSSTLSTISGSRTEGFWEVCWVLTRYKSKITFSRKLFPKLVIYTWQPVLHVKCWIIWSSDCAKSSQTWKRATVKSWHAACRQGSFWDCPSILPSPSPSWKREIFHLTMKLTWVTCQ